MGDGAINEWLMFMMSLTLTLAVAGGVVDGFSMGDNNSNPSAGDTTGAVGTSGGRPADGWHFVQLSGWTVGCLLWLPPGWELKELQGIDSHVGEIVGDDVTLTFDLGWYSSTLVHDDDPLHAVLYDDIGDRLAKLVRPKDGTDGTITGVYFENFDSDKDAAPWGRNRLQISGAGLTLQQQQIAFVIFRSIRLIVS